MTTQFFESYTAALTSYSAEKISACYQVPLTVYSDQGIQQVSAMSEVEAFWKEGIKPYKAQGICQTKYTLLSEEQLSKSLWLCKVLWENFDSAHNKTSQETNVYILARDSDTFKIVGLILMGYQA